MSDWQDGFRDGAAHAAHLTKAAWMRKIESDEMREIVARAIINKVLGLQGVPLNPRYGHAVATAAITAIAEELGK